VTAAIQEKAPGADLYAVKVFDRVLGTRIGNLIRAIDWSAEAGMQLANLSLGTSKIEHEPALRAAVERAAGRGLLVVSARDDEGVRWLPGSLPGVVPVQLDWDCPRDQYRIVEIDGAPVFRASGFPREIPGVPPARNLHGISFAVANMTGFAARTLQVSSVRTVEELIALLIAERARGVDARGATGGQVAGEHHGRD
jgi:hypothetical protein